MMQASTWHALEAKFQRAPFLRAETPMTKAEVLSVFADLGRPVNSDYAAFLERYGGAMVGALPVFGLRPVEPMGSIWNVLEVNRRYRREAWPGVSEWVVCSMDQAGNPIGIADDGSVWTCDHDFGGVAAEAKSFEDFIRRRCLRIDR